MSINELNRLAEWVESHGFVCETVGGRLGIDVPAVYPDGRCVLERLWAASCAEARQILGY